MYFKEFVEFWVVIEILSAAGLRFSQQQLSLIVYKQTLGTLVIAVGIVGVPLKQKRVLS